MEPKRPTDRKSLSNGLDDDSRIGHFKSIFRDEGEYWTIEHRGAVMRLRNTKGLRYLSQLLRHPNVPIAALELCQSSARGRAASPVDPEHARVSVTKRIHAAIAKISAHNAILGEYFRLRVHTGHECLYEPGIESTLRWETNQRDKAKS